MMRTMQHVKFKECSLLISSNYSIKSYNIIIIKIVIIITITIINNNNNNNNNNTNI